APSITASFTTTCAWSWTNRPPRRTGNNGRTVAEPNRDRHLYCRHMFRPLLCLRTALLDQFKILLAPPSAFSGRRRHRSKRSALGRLPILAFSQLPNALQPVLPALGQAVAMFGQEQSHPAVEEPQARHAPLCRQAVLQVIDRRVRHHER